MELHLGLLLFAFGDLGHQTQGLQPCKASALLLSPFPAPPRNLSVLRDQDPEKLHCANCACLCSPAERLCPHLHHHHLLTALPRSMAPLDLCRKCQLKFLLCHHPDLQRGAGESQGQSGAGSFLRPWTCGLVPGICTLLNCPKTVPPSRSSYSGGEVRGRTR